MAGVTSSYPAALDSESNLTPPNNGDTLSVADHWLAGNSGPIVAIETELGTDPAGSFTDVKSRLDDVDKNVITEIDQWYLTANTSAGVGGDLTANWSRWGTLFSEKGTGLSQSSGIFQFPSTGYYRIIGSFYLISSTATYVGALIRYSTDNFVSVANVLTDGYNNAYTTNSYAHVTLDAILKITDIANQKIKFQWSANSSTAIVIGTLTGLSTHFSSAKIGEL